MIKTKGTIKITGPFVKNPNPKLNVNKYKYLTTPPLRYFTQAYKLKRTKVAKNASVVKFLEELNTIGKLR